MQDKIIKFLKKSDYIGKTFNFRYKSYENYRSLMGGIAFISFLIITIASSILNLYFLLLRVNKSINNNDLIIFPTDKMNFLNYSFSLGFSISCNQYDEKINTPLNDLFEMDFKYVYNNNGNSVRTKIGLHLCNYSDFSSHLIEKSEIKKYIETEQYYCPDNLNYLITGIYGDDFFSYYEIILLAKKLDDFTEYYNLLINYDCKYHYIISLIAFDLNNYSYPIKNVLKDYSIQINPLAYKKRNVFLKLNEFQSSKNLFILNYKTKYYLDYSRYDDYLLYKPKERFEKKILDYENFISFYFLADNMRKLISRKYKTLPEYSSEVFTGLSVFYIIIFGFVSIINNFYANHSIMKELFQFKKTEKNNRNGIFNKLKIKISENKIKRLSKMSKIAEFGNFKPGELETQSLFSKIKNKIKNSNNLSNIEISPFVSIIDNNSINNLDISGKINDIINNENVINNNKTFVKKKINAKKILSLSNSSIASFDKLNNLSIINSNEKDKNSIKSHNIKSNISNNIFKTINIHSKKDKKKKKINLHYSIYEIIISIFCPSCSSSNLKTKNKLLEKAKYKLFYGLDILTYLRNLQKTEYLNFILLEPYQNVLIGYMTKPSISLDYQFDVFEHLKSKYNPDFNEGNVNYFLKSYYHLSEMKQKSAVDTRLYNIVNIELENLCVE